MGWFIFYILVQIVIWVLLWKGARVSKPKIKKQIGIFLYVYTLTCLSVDILMILMKCFGLASYDGIRRISDVCTTLSLIVIIPCSICSLFLVSYNMKRTTRVVSWIMGQKWWSSVSLYVPMAALLLAIVGMGFSFSFHLL